MPKDSVVPKHRGSKGLAVDVKNLAEMEQFQEVAPLAICYVRKHADVAVKMLESINTDKVDPRSFYKCGTIVENTDFEIEEDDVGSEMDELNRSFSRKGAKDHPAVKYCKNTVNRGRSAHGSDLDKSGDKLNDSIVSNVSAQSPAKIRKNIASLKNTFFKGLGNFVDNTIDLQMNNHVWKRAVTYNGLNLLVSIPNFSVTNTEERRITKQVVSSLNFNSLRLYSYCYNYREFVDLYLNDLVQRPDGKFDYIIGNEEPLDWEFQYDTGLALVYKIVKEGFESPLYKVNLPMIRIYNPKTYNTNSVGMKLEDWKFIKEKGIKDYVEPLIEKYLGDWVSYEYQNFLQATQGLVRLVTEE